METTTSFLLHNYYFTVEILIQRRRPRLSRPTFPTKPTVPNSCLALKGQRAGLFAGVFVPLPPHPVRFSVWATDQGNCGNLGVPRGREGERTISFSLPRPRVSGKGPWLICLTPLNAVHQPSHFTSPFSLRHYHSHVNTRSRAHDARAYT